MAGLVPATHVLTPCKLKGVDGRDIRAFTPVFDGLLPGQDDVDRPRTSQARAYFFAPLTGSFTASMVDNSTL